MTIGTFGLLWLTVLVVRGNATCPTPADVRARLALLAGDAPAAGSAGSAHTATVMAGKEGLTITLWDGAGRRLAERALAAGAPCADLAAAAAVVLASWQSDVRAGVELRPLPPAAPTVTAALPPLMPTRSNSPSPLRFEFGAGVTGRGGRHPGGRLDTSMSRLGAGWRGVAAAFVTPGRALALGQGAVEWHRLGLAVGPRWVHEGVFLWTSVEGLLYAGRIALEGEGLSEKASAEAWDGGMELGLRGGTRWGRWLPWLAVVAQASPVRRTAVVEDGPSRPLPQTDWSVGVGLSYAWPTPRAPARE